MSGIKESVESKGAGKKEKKPTGQETRKQKAATTADMSNNMSSPEKARNLNTSTPRKELKDKSKEVTRNTSAEKILENFQSRDLVTEDWNLLADQVLTRGVQREAEAILKNADGSEDERNNAPTGFSMNQTRLKYQSDGAESKRKTRDQFVSEIH